MANVGESHETPYSGDWEAELEDRASMYEVFGASPEDSDDLAILISTIEGIAGFDTIADFNSRVGYRGSVSVEAKEVLYDADQENGVRRFLMRVPRPDWTGSNENLYVIGKQYYQGDDTVYGKLIVIWKGDDGLRINHTHLYPGEDPNDSIPLLTVDERHSPFTWQDFSDVCEDLDMLDVQLQGTEHRYGN